MSQRGVPQGSRRLPVRFVRSGGAFAPRSFPHNDTSSIRSVETMPIYLFEVSYSESGTQGLLRDGGTQRHEEIQAVMDELGGALHSLYYSMGEADAYAIAELPRDKAAALLTPEDVDEAAEMARNLDYQPPGQ
jgi:uncharacterized protein with GYD domain